MASFYYYCPCKVMEVGIGLQQGDAAYMNWPIDKVKCKYCEEGLTLLNGALARAILSVRGGKRVMKRLVDMGRD